jgi:ribosomal protein S17E
MTRWEKFKDIISKKWDTLKWLIKELIKVASNEKSFFSKKRIMEMIAFTSGETTLLSFFFYNISRLSTMEAIAIATVFFSVAGYTLNKTEAAKKNYINDNKENNLKDTE